MGKPYRLVLEVSETIRGDDVERLELVLSLQSTHFLEYLREQSVEFMLVGGRNHLDSSPSAEIGIEEQGERVDGEWYQFRLLDPVEIPESGPGAAIASLTLAFTRVRGSSFALVLAVVSGCYGLLLSIGQGIPSAGVDPVHFLSWLPMLVGVFSVHRWAKAKARQSNAANKRIESNR